MKFFKVFFLSCVLGLCVAVSASGQNGELNGFLNSQCPLVEFDASLQHLGDNAYELWFAPKLGEPQVTWVDVHFTVNPQPNDFYAQHNWRMQQNGNVWTQDRMGENPLYLAPGDEVYFFFTVDSNNVDCDTEWFIFTAPKDPAFTLQPRIPPQQAITPVQEQDMPQYYHAQAYNPVPNQQFSATPYQAAPQYNEAPYQHAPAAQYAQAQYQSPAQYQQPVQAQQLAQPLQQYAQPIQYQSPQAFQADVAPLVTSPIDPQFDTLQTAELDPVHVSHDADVFDDSGGALFTTSSSAVIDWGAEVLAKDVMAKDVKGFVEPLQYEYVPKTYVARQAYRPEPVYRARPVYERVQVGYTQGKPMKQKKVRTTETFVVQEAIPIAPVVQVQQQVQQYDAKGLQMDYGKGYVEQAAGVVAAPNIVARRGGGHGHGNRGGGGVIGEAYVPAYGVQAGYGKPW